MDLKLLKKKIVANDPLLRDENGNVKNRIGTVFLSGNSIKILSGPTVHAILKIYFISDINEMRIECGLPELNSIEEEHILSQTVDLIMDNQHLFIRPDPGEMDIAFKADDALQRCGIPITQIKFLGTLDASVRNEIKKQGQCWRLQEIPRNMDEVKQMITSSITSIGTPVQYYYNSEMGIRHLTFKKFCRIEELPVEGIRECLKEIQFYSRRTNDLGNPEIAFFKAGAFCSESLEKYNFRSSSDDEITTYYRKLKTEFHRATAPKFRDDNFRNPEWRLEVFKSLIRSENIGIEKVLEEVVLGLSDEFYMQVAWLPGGRIADGKLIPDPVITKSIEFGDNTELKKLIDPKIDGIIRNLLDEYRNIEYVNIGRVESSLSSREAMTGRRGVYLAVIKLFGKEEEILKFIRMQKRNISFYLDCGLGLEEAKRKSVEYTRNVLNRHSACRKLKMNLLPVSSKRTGEVYTGSNMKYCGTEVSCIYFERQYFFGYATDKIQTAMYKGKRFSIKLANLLGIAAASNIVAGRIYKDKVIFDDGDELVMINNNMLPVNIFVTDITASFNDCETPLSEFAKEYAEVVNSRTWLVPDIKKFTKAYIKAFKKRLKEIKKDYLINMEEYYYMFNPDTESSEKFREKWNKTLLRLENTDVDALCVLVENNID